MNDHRENNFDLIRLFAATQVVIGHSLAHYKVHAPDWFYFLWGLFPGVPVFFVVSGFLISLSYERAPSLSSYYKNRFLRIYPGLWVCFCITAFIVIASGVVYDFYDFFVWLLAQISFFQFYNPDFLRGFGVGVVNGSLWTIPVELQFYLIVPVLYYFSRNKWFVVLLLLVCIVAQWINLFISRETLVEKLYAVSILPYLYIFLLGILFRYFYGARSGLFKGRFLLWISFYTCFLWLVKANFFGLDERVLYPLSMFLLAGVVTSLAFSFSSLSRALLRGNDISYGVYVYHMLVINLVLVFLPNISITPKLLLTLLLTFVLASLSWLLVERPALKYK